MNRIETLTIMKVLQAAYPNFYKGMTKGAADDIVDLWATMFADDPVEVVALAVKSHIASDSKGFPPHIGAIKEAIGKLKAPKETTEQEAWNMIKNATRNSLYGSREEFDKLPPVVQKLVGSPNQLREWAAMDSETLNSVVASNFMRSYKVMAAREKERLALPPDVRNVMEQLADGMSGLKFLQEEN